MVTVLSGNGFFFGKKMSPCIIYARYDHDVLFWKALSVEVSAHKKLWKFDTPKLIYRSMMSNNNGIFLICPEMVFFQEKKKHEKSILHAVNYKQNSQNTNTFCFSFISSNNVEI